MNSKFSIIGILLAVLSIALYLVALSSWGSNDGLTSVISPYYAKFLSLFSSTQLSGPTLAAGEAHLTEERSIYITIGIALFFGALAIFLSLFSIKRQESLIYIIAALLLGNAVFVLYSLKTALFILVVSGCCAIYLQSRLTSDYGVNP